VFFFKADPVIADRDLTTDPQQLSLPERELLQSTTTTLSLVDLEQLIARTSQRNSEDPLLPNLYNQLGILHYRRLQTGAYDDYLTEQR
jgi:hypothetical protein